jgi:chromosome segregation ATPase
LKETIAELEKKLAAAEQSGSESKAQHTAKLSVLEKDKNEWEQKHRAATIRLEELETFLAASEATKVELEAASKQVSAAQEELTQLKAKHDEVSKELAESKSYNTSIEEKLAQGEKDLNAQIDKNMTLLNQLGEVESSISGGRKRVRELEAELAALKAERDLVKGSNVGLEGSRWATDGEKDQALVTEEGEAAKAEGEDIGSSIEGTVGPPVYDRCLYA